MVAQLSKPGSPQIVYPEDDGLPRSDNTKQFRWIMTFYYNLDWLFADNPEVFVAGNLLWYPVEGEVKTCQAPDVMVVFGAGKGDRGSYQQWNEKNIAPQVAIEILSPGNTQTQMYKKLLFYDRHGVEEYYVYDPHTNQLSGLIRASQSNLEEAKLQVIEEIQGWTSPRLGIRFELGEEELQLYRPDGERFATYLEAQQQLERERQRAEQERQRAEQERQRAEQERQRAEQQSERAEQERQRAEQQSERAEQEHRRAETERQRAEQQSERAEQEHRRAEQERQRAEQVEMALAEERRKAEILAEQLRQLGMNPNNLD